MEKQKKSLIVKAFERCRSFVRRRPSSPVADAAPKGKRSVSAGGGQQRGGCFTVHVGLSKERFVISTACIGHPLFRTLLDEAEVVYGFASPGPLELPCDVELFRRVMCEIDQETVAPPKCGGGFSRCYSAGGHGGGARYQLLSPSRFIVAGDL